MSWTAQLATSIDRIGWRKRLRDVRTGWPATSRPDIHFYDGSDVQIRYRERGTGTPLVFAADPPVTLELYDELLEVFSRRFRVIAFELPGMGFSAVRGGFDFSFESVNDSIAEFLCAVAGQPAILAFSCGAGLGAVDIARRYPPRVSRLVIIQTPSWSEEIKWKNGRDPQKILRRPFLGQLAMLRMKKRRAPLWLSLSMGPTNRKLLQFCSCAAETLERKAGWTMASAFQLYLPDDRRDLPPAPQPAIALWGAQDGSHLQTNKLSSIALADRVQFVEFSDLGHFPELEDPARVFEHVARFAADDRTTLMQPPSNVTTFA
jgi:pimeloyl-ACP methyl ester carboxylesterase